MCWRCKSGRWLRTVRQRRDKPGASLSIKTLVDPTAPSPDNLWQPVCRGSSLVGVM